MDKGIMTKSLQSWAVVNARTTGFYKGKDESMSNAEELTMLDKATTAWLEWAKTNNIDATNTQQETYHLMREAFEDGYLKGFVKRLTEGA